MIYLTSDLHLKHDKPFIYEKRGFNSIQEHDKEIIENINKVVAPEDTLYILGDLGMQGEMDKASFNDYLATMLGNIGCEDIHIIRGNHDTDEKMEVCKSLGFTIHDYGYELINHKQRYFLSHYPTLTQNGSLKGALHREVINLYGHTHQTEQFLEVNGIQVPLSFHIGLDSNNLKPVELGKVRELVRDNYIKQIESGTYPVYERFLTNSANIQTKDTEEIELC